MLKRVRAGHLAVFFLLTGLLCIAAFHFIGASIETDGVLNEPFFLISLASGSFMFAAIAGVMHFLRSR